MRDLLPPVAFALELLALYLRTSGTSPSDVLRSLLSFPVPVVYTSFSLVPHDCGFTIFGPVGTLVVYSSVFESFFDSFESVDQSLSDKWMLGVGTLMACRSRTIRLYCPSVQATHLWN
jgi:hypothetical protein